MVSPETIDKDDQLLQNFDHLHLKFVFLKHCLLIKGIISEIHIKIFMCANYTSHS
jgi:hypothetical protein